MKFEFTNYDAGVMVASAIFLVVAGLNGPLPASAFVLFMVVYPIVNLLVTNVWPKDKE